MTHDYMRAPVGGKKNLLGDFASPAHDLHQLPQPLSLTPNDLDKKRGESLSLYMLKQEQPSVVKCKLFCAEAEVAGVSDSKAVTGSPTNSSYVMSKRFGCKQITQTIDRRDHGTAADRSASESGRKKSRAYRFGKSPGRDFAMASAYSGNPTLTPFEPLNVPLQLQGQANVIDGSPRMGIQQAQFAPVYNFYRPQPIGFSAPAPPFFPGCFPVAHQNGWQPSYVIGSPKTLGKQGAIPAQHQYRSTQAAGKRPHSLINRRKNNEKCEQNSGNAAKPLKSRSRHGANKGSPAVADVDDHTMALCA